jgi:asparagine synthetase B (glutamine-hydrolysing)
MQDLYYRRIGGAVYFSGRIEPLVELGDSPLHVNWGAWASTLALTAPIGEDTPFVEIRRLPAASAWVLRDGSLRMESFEPSWMDEAIDPSFDAADAVDALAGSIRFDKRTVLALSGGWDSRLLGMLARRRTSKMEAWTTSPDDGRDLDIEYARPVAEQLGMRHHVVIPDERGWLDEFSEVRRRTSFQTVHHVWLMPLARALHGEGAPMLDGLAGDVLFKATYVPEALFSEREPEKQRQLLWEGLENRRLRSNEFLRPEVAQSFIDLNTSAFAGATAPFAGHEAAVTLAKIHTRAARAIAPSPFWVFGPEIKVELPFLQPEVVRAALRVPLAAKVDGAFYGRMLQAADPRIAGLPSTNDGAPDTPAGPRRQTSPESLKSFTEQIRSSEVVMRLLTAEARESITEPVLSGRPGRQRRKFVMLHWASLFADWLQHYESRLAIEDFSAD